MGVIADYGKHTGKKDCDCLKCCMKEDTRAQKLVKILEKYITPFDIVGVHPCSWKAETLLNMKDKEFDKVFKDVFRKQTMGDVYGDKTDDHLCCEHCGMCIDCGDCKDNGCGKKGVGQVRKK